MVALGGYYVVHIYTISGRLGTHRTTSGAGSCFAVGSDS